MDISRRSVLSVIGVGLGSVGLAAATGMNNSTTQESENEDDKDDSTEPGDKSDANEKNENENEGSDSEEDEASDGNDHAEKNEGADNGNVGDVKLSRQEAEDIATQKVGGGTVQRVENEVEDAPKYSGTPVYNVIVKTSAGAIKEVTVNANTGDVLKVDNGA